jgi:mucin-19
LALQALLVVFIRLEPLQALAEATLALPQIMTLARAALLTLAANTSGSAANIVYDTTSGDKTSSIISGTLTIASSASTSAINYTVKSAGSALNPGLIGTGTIVLPGSITIDNTFGSASGDKATGYVTASIANRLVNLATTSIGVTLNAAIFARDNITINGSSNSNRGIDTSVNITSTNGNVFMNGATVATIGVYVVAGNVVTGNNITINGSSTTAPSWVTQIAGMTINSTSVGGSIIVTGNVVGIPGAAGGIYQIGTITGASGSNISFTSNNNISQNGAISLAANTSTNSSNVSYDVTAGNKNSSISTGQLTVAAGSLSNINYSVLASGAAINIANAVTVPGAVTLDNTYGCSGSGCVPATGYLNTALTNWNTFVTTGGYGVLVGGNISGTAITINGVNAGGSTGGGGAVMLTAGLTATSGNINITGLTTAGLGVGNLYMPTLGVYRQLPQIMVQLISQVLQPLPVGVELGPNNSISANQLRHWF